MVLGRCKRVWLLAAVILTAAYPARADFISSIVDGMTMAGRSGVAGAEPIRGYFRQDTAAASADDVGSGASPLSVTDLATGMTASLAANGSDGFLANAAEGQSSTNLTFSIDGAEIPAPTTIGIVGVSLAYLGLSRRRS